MDIVALYKGFEGTEFLDSSIESIYDFCSKIVVVNSEVSWSGQPGNTTHAHVAAWKEQNDKADKIINLLGSWTSQYDQYMHGVRYCQENLKFDYFLIIDTDEVWDSENLTRAAGFLQNDNGVHNAFRTKMFTYVKSPFYRIEPVEPCSPIAFVKSDIKDFAGIRGSDIAPAFLIPDVFFHHFCYVRLDDETIKRKFTNSHIGDGVGHSHRDRWMSNIWRRIPHVVNFHPTQGAEWCWRRVRVITEADLPTTVRNKEVIYRFPRK